MIINMLTYDNQMSQLTYKMKKNCSDTCELLNLLENRTRLLASSENVRVYTDTRNSWNWKLEKSVPGKPLKQIRVLVSSRISISTSTPPDS